MMFQNQVFAEFGDILLSERGFYQHVGVSVGNGHVLTNSPTRGEHVTSLSDFSDGKPVSVRKLSAASRMAVVNNVAAVLASPKPYSLIGNNCDHTACKALGLPPTSPQLKRWAAIIGIVGFASVIVRS